MKTKFMQHIFQGLQNFMDTKPTFDAHLRIIIFWMNL